MTCLLKRRQGSTNKLVPDGLLPLAGFEVITEALKESSL
jgi:hypothetical protein